MAHRPVHVLCAALLLGAWCWVPAEAASETSNSEPGLVQRLEDQAKEVGQRVDETFRKTAKEIEEKRIPEKTEKKVKEIVDDVVKGFEKTGEHIEKKLKE